jgi:hypothetical protein
MPALDRRHVLPLTTAALAGTLLGGRDEGCLRDVSARIDRCLAG